jgi:pimeloyl-ACP methyl ester carboxylesterase
MILFVHGVPDTPASWRPLISTLGLGSGAYLAPALPGFGSSIPQGFSRTKDAYVA